MNIQHTEKDNIFDLREKHYKVAKILVEKIAEYQQSDNKESENENEYERKRVIPYRAIYENHAFTDNSVCFRNIGAVLEPLTLYTYYKYKVFISSIVVTQNSFDHGFPMPGDGFRSMYEAVAKENLDREKIKAQRDKVYSTDWSNLLDEIRQAIDK